MKLLLSVFIIFVLMFSTIVFAETKVSVDLEKLDAKSRDVVINAQKETSEQLTSVNKENLVLFKDYGKAIAETFAEVCKTLNVEVNNFANTPVGQLTMWLIVYKVVGKDIIHIVLTISLWLAITMVCATYVYIFHMPKKLVKRDANKVITEIQYIQKFRWNDNSARAVAAFICASFWAISTIVAYFRI